MNPELREEFQDIFLLFQESLNSKDSVCKNQKEHEELVKKIISNNSSKKYQERIEQEILGYGPLDSILHLPFVNEIIVNGETSISYEEQGEMKTLQDCFLSSCTFNNIVEKILAEAQLTLDIKKPFAEGRWKDFRVHIIRPPLVEMSFHLVFRKHPKNSWSFSSLEEQGWAPKEAMDILKDFIQQRCNFLIVGPTSSGKTSLLNACLRELSPLERVISIEDTSEILLANRISTKLLTQLSPEQNLSLIDQAQLVKQSLRLRPDRLVMGEVRGPEAKDLLMALTTGHRGSIGTLHSESASQALWKLETLAGMGMPQGQQNTIQRLIFSCLQGVVVLGKYKKYRFLKGIYKLTGLEPTGFLWETLFERNLKQSL